MQAGLQAGSLPGSGVALRGRGGSSVRGRKRLVSLEVLGDDPPFSPWSRSLPGLPPSGQPPGPAAVSCRDRLVGVPPETASSSLGLQSGVCPVYTGPGG